MKIVLCVWGLAAQHKDIWDFSWFLSVYFNLFLLSLQYNLVRATKKPCRALGCEYAENESILPKCQQTASSWLWTVLSRAKVLGIRLICIAGEDSCCSPVISRRDRTVQALPAPTVPRRSSSSGGDWEGGAKLGVAVFRLPCSVMSGSSCQRDTSTPQPSSSPPNRTCAGQKPSFFCLELFPAWVDSVGLGQCRSTEP